MIKITKTEFLLKVKELMEDDEFPYDLPQQILKDLSKVQFDFENYTEFDDDEGFCNGKYPVGYRKLVDDFHVFFVNAGGDWEFPICFIFYWDGGKLRAYIPADGNAWNKEENCAYGNGTDLDLDDMDKEIDEYKMINDIIKTLKL